MRKSLILAALALAFTLPQAEAALYRLSYDSPTVQIDAIIDGTLQADNNTLVVTQSDTIQNVTVGGNPVVVALPFMAMSADGWLGAVSNPPAYATLTIDGSYMDFLAVGSIDSDPNAHNYYIFAFEVGNVVATQNGSYAGYAEGAAAGVNETFDPAHYSLTPFSVPAPATLPLFMPGVAAMLWRRRNAVRRGNSGV